MKLSDLAQADEILMMAGNNMTPTFEQGDELFISYKSPHFKALPGDICIITTTSEQRFVKRVYPLTAKKLLLKSDNKEFDDMEISISNIKRIGIVAGFFRSVGHARPTLF